jgi:high-affinity nickel permease
MDYYSLLFLGCIVGIQHALEADHLAAVAALTARRSSRRALILRGSVWGLGHTFTLLTVCGMLLLLGTTITPYVEASLELAVGLMIVVLGVNVLYTLWRRRPHFHVHQHDSQGRHIHVHTHFDELVPHSESCHLHSHRNLGLRGALFVGMVHGVAGSAGLLVLAAAAGSVAQALGYIVAFGAGSIAGMAALSFVASYPLKFVESYADWIGKAAFAGIGCAAIYVGGHLMIESWASL